MQVPVIHALNLLVILSSAVLASFHQCTKVNTGSDKTNADKNIRLSGLLDIHISSPASHLHQPFALFCHEDEISFCEFVSWEWLLGISQFKWTDIVFFCWTSK